MRKGSVIFMLVYAGILILGATSLTSEVYPDVVIRWIGEKMRWTNVPNAEPNRKEKQ